MNTKLLTIASVMVVLIAGAQKLQTALRAPPAHAPGMADNRSATPGLEIYTVTNSATLR